MYCSIQIEYVYKLLLHNQIYRLYNIYSYFYDKVEQTPLLIVPSASVKNWHVQYFVVKNGFSTRIFIVNSKQPIILDVLLMLNGSPAVILI